jgi:uncharacterized protein YjaG (DUF416 family)
MRNLTTATALTIASLVGPSLATVTPAQAKTCKEPVSVTSRSTVKTSEDARTKRATENAEKKWSKDVRAKYGLQYYFWTRSTDKKVECRQTPKSAICIATATPCSLL